MKVKKVNRHEKWNPHTVDYDFALLTLERPVRLSEKVQVIVNQPITTFKISVGKYYMDKYIIRNCKYMLTCINISQYRFRRRVKITVLTAKAAKSVAGDIKNIAKRDHVVVQTCYNKW